MVSFGNLSAQAGEKSKGFLAVPGTDFTIPATLICGERPGKTVYQRRCTQLRICRHRGGDPPGGRACSGGNLRDGADSAPGQPAGL